MSGIKKYYFGLGILALLTIALTVFVVSQGSAHKRDQEVNKLANAISDDLNSHISSKNEIPENLNEATSEEIPEEITYTKESDKAYKFCVTYNNKSGNPLNANSIVNQGLSGSYSNDSSYYDYESDYKPTRLYVSGYSWNKGENCYSVEPNIRTTRNYFNTNTSSVCDEDYEYYSVYKDYCVDGEYDPSSFYDNLQ